MSLKLPKKGEETSWVTPFTITGEVKYPTPSTAPTPSFQPASTEFVNGRSLRNLTIKKNKNGWGVRGEYSTGSIYAVDLYNDLLCPHDQDGQAKITEAARTVGDFGVFSMRDYHTLFDTLYCLRDTKEAKEAREFIQKSMRSNWLTTLTRIKYMPGQKGTPVLDEVWHDYGLASQVKVNEELVGPDGEIKQMNPGKELSAILGDSDVSRISEIYQWINNTPTYLWRVSSRDKSDVKERVARFLAGSGGADFGCGGNPSDTDSALGVRFASP